MNGFRLLVRAATFMAVVAAFAWLPPAVAQNSAQGSITINGAKTSFAHAYAFTKAALSDKKPETTLIFSDKPLSAKAVTDTFERMRARNKDGFKTMELTFDENKRLTSVQFSIEPMSGGGYSSSYKVDLDAMTDKMMKGRAYTDGEQTMFKDRYSFDVRFDLAMTVPRAADATGKAAWSTPQGKVVAEYLRAARAGDKAGLRKLLVAERAKDLDGPQAVQILEFLKLSEDPNTADFDSLTIDGDSAEAVIATRTKDGASSSRYKLARVGGVWKVSP